MAITKKPTTGARGKQPPVTAGTGTSAARPNSGKAAKSGAAAGVSLKPRDAIAGGGLFDDFDGQIIDARFVEFDYDGNIDEPVLAICLEIRNEEEEDNEEAGRGTGQNPFMEHYSAGPLSNFVPSDDGLQAIPAGSKTGLSGGCYAVMLLTSVVEADPEMEEKIGSSLEALQGLRAHFKRATWKKREGLEQEEKNEKGYKRMGPLLVEHVLEGKGKTTLAGGKARVAGDKVPPKTGKKPAEPVAAPGGDDEVMNHAIAYIAEQLEANGGGVEKDALPKKVFKYAKDNELDNATRNGILEYVGNEDWLSEQGEYFEFDGESLTSV